MMNFSNLNLTRRLTKIASAVGMAEPRVAFACDDLKLIAEHVPAVAEALRYIEPAARFLEPLFDELHKIINDPACAGITLSDGAEGQQPPESGQGPAADTQSANDHKPGSAVSLLTLFNSAAGINTSNGSVAKSVLEQFLNAADESQPESESEFESECPMFAQVASLTEQVASLTEQVATLQNDVKTLVDLNRELYDNLRTLGYVALGRAVAKSN